MAPSKIDSPVEESFPFHPSKRAPIVYSGSLDGFQHDDVTPAIGREYTTANIVEEILNAPNSEELLRDLAYTSTLIPPQIQALY